MRVVGLISGTSMDGLDVAVADLDGAGSEELLLRPLGARTVPWDAALRRRLLGVLPPAATTIQEVAELDVLVGRASGLAARAAIDEIAGGTSDLVVSHGQTVFHWVTGGRARGTLQLGQPAEIVEATGLPVVSDLRARDIAAGGQGAPLAGTLDVLLLRGLGLGAPAAALNLGGIANVTVVPPDGAPLAFDTGPASCLVDATVTRLTDGRQTYDIDGRRAAAGRVDDALLRVLLAEPFFALPPPRSTGRELFTAGFVDRALSRVGHPVADDDLLATLTELTAVTVADSLAGQSVSRVYASGGGVHNPTMRAALHRRLGAVELRTSDELGLPVDAKEAYLMALIGYLTWHGVPGVLPGTTGAREPHVLGRVSPAGGRVPPPPTDVRPRRLTIAR